MQSTAYQIFIKIAVITLGSLGVITHVTSKRFNAITGAPTILFRLALLFKEDLPLQLSKIALL